MELQLPIPKERILQLAQQVDQASINLLTKAIIDINNDDQYLIKLAELNGFIYKPKPIKVYIDSYGGHVYQCLGLLGVMGNSVVPVHTIVTGCAMSCGFLIAVAGHERYAYDKATFMYHQVSTGFEGKIKDMDEDFIETKRLQKIIETHTLSKTKLTKKQLTDNYNAKKDWYINTKDALKYKIIDEII